MRLDIRESNLHLSRQTRTYVAHRAHFALSRFGDRIVGIRVLLSEERGPGRRVDRACKVAVTVRGVVPFAVEHHAAGLDVAVDQAFDRVARQVARALERVARPWRDWGPGAPRGAERRR